MDLFGTAGVRGPVRSNITPSLAVKLGRAAAVDGTEFVLGRDGRETGDGLAAAVSAGLQSGGADVFRLGRVPTPALAYASRGRRGVMVTASHNPPSDNGLKFFVDGTEYGNEAERRMESRLDSEPQPVEWNEWGRSNGDDVLEEYRGAVEAYAVDAAGRCEGVSVAVDCGNGTSSFVTPQVLGSLGASVTTLNASVDGHFPGRASKPTPESLEDLRSFVADGQFDIGIGHDGDGDRIVVTDADGEIVHEDTVLAILAGHYTETSAAGDPVVVTTPNASGRIDERVEAAGGRVERTHLGELHEGVAAVNGRGGDGTSIAFAAEPWKHLHTGFGPWIDATVSAGVITALVATHGFSDLREPITERPYRKVSVECPDDRKAVAMKRLENRLPELFSDIETSTEYGVRLSFPDGSWTLVRPSGTEPYIRIYAESDDVEALVSSVVETVERTIREA